MLRKIARLVIVVCLVFGVGTIKMGCECECEGESVICKRESPDYSERCMSSTGATGGFTCLGCAPEYINDSEIDIFYYKCEKPGGIGTIAGTPCDTCDPPCSKVCGETKFIAETPCADRRESITACLGVCGWIPG